MSGADFPPAGGKAGGLFWVVLALLAVLDIATVIPLASNAAGLSGELGQVADASWRIFAGQLPGVDFKGLYGPLTYWWNALWFWLFGADWRALSLGQLVAEGFVTLGLAALSALVALRQDWSRVLFLLAIGLVCQYIGPRIWLPFAGFCLVLGAGTSARVIAGCAMCGVSLLVSPETGLASCAGSALLLLVGKGRRGRVPALASLAVPSLLALLLAPAMVREYVRNTAGLAGVTAYYGGLGFPPFTKSTAFICYSPFVFTGFMLLRSLVLLFDTNRDRRETAAGDFALALVSAGFLRSALGRSDYGHLCFGMVPGVLLFLRACERLPRAAGAALAVACLVPFARMTWVDAWSTSWDFLRAHNRADWAELPGQRVRMPPGVIARFGVMRAGVDSYSRPGDPVLFLPLPFYAGLFGRHPAIPFLLPEHMVIAPDYSALAISMMEERRVPLVVLDRPACLPDGGQCLRTTRPGAFSGNINWETPADEVIFREFREYLRSRYRLARAARGLEFYVRREVPLPPPRDTVVARAALPPSGEQTLARGDAVEITVPALRCDEVRVDIACRYLPGLKSFAKTMLWVSWEDSRGLRTEGALRIPPARLGKDLRFTTGGAALRKLSLRVVPAGALEPFPRSVRLRGVSLVRFGASGARSAAE